MTGVALYVSVRMTEHHRSDSRGFVLEHVLIAEAALGRPLLRKHEVHHVDRNGRNNAPTNLVLCEDHAYHLMLHARQRALDACGDANAKRCLYCHGYERQEEVVPHGNQFCHRSCDVANWTRRNAARRERRRASGWTPRVRKVVDLDGMLQERRAAGLLRWGTKTHCKHGHEYTAENTLLRPDGTRYCRQCKSISDRDCKRRRQERRTLSEVWS